MNIFTITKPNITKEEYNRTRNELSGQGFSTKELAYVDKLVEPHLKDADKYGDTPGVSEAEAKDIEEQVQKPDPHNVYTVDLPPHKVEILKQAFDKYLKK